MNTLIVIFLVVAGMTGLGMTCHGLINAGRIGTAANSLVETFPQDNGNNAPGVVYAANATRFDQANFSQALTTYGLGYRDPEDNEANLTLVTGRAIPSSMKPEYATFTNAEEFYSDSDDVRPIGGDFKRVERKSDKVIKRLANRGLMIRIDLDEVMDNPGWEERTVAYLKRRLFRNELRRAVGLISAAAVNTAKTWDTTALKDPDMDVINELVTAADLSGIRPTRVIFGETAWTKRMLSFRAQNTAGGYASAGMTPEQLTGLLRVDKVGVVSSRYQSSASAKTGIVGNLALMYCASDAGDTEDPSNIKRLVNGAMRVYQQQISAKLVDITVEYHSLTVIPSTLAVRQFTIS
jgi:hypothetical protein